VTTTDTSTLSDGTSDTSTDTTGTTDLTDSQPTTTLSNNASSSGVKTAAVSHLAISRIKSTSAVVSWSGTAGSKYTIQYGTNPSNLANTVSYTSHSKTASLTLRNLPADKTVYVAVVPTGNGVLGSVRTVSFKTAVPGGLNPIVVGGAVVGVLVLGLAAVWLLRRTSAPKSAKVATTVPDIKVDPHLPPPFPREDPAEYQARVNWWQQPQNAQRLGATAVRRKRDDDIPDMFDEGNQRLEQEQRRHPRP
jgi:hypothetical protein